MATLINNQATLNYNSGTDERSTSSNIASVTMHGPLEINKYALENVYRIGEQITYNIIIKNTSANDQENVTILDDLGTYILPNDVMVTPLTYVNPAKLFTDHVFTSTLDGTVSDEKDSVSFLIETLAGNSTIVIQYKATVNQYAGADIGDSVIENTVSVKAAGIEETLTAAYTLPVASYADVVIEKAMSPDPVVDNTMLTYSFDIRNNGTLPATTVKLIDSFDPIPEIDIISVNGITTDDYTMEGRIFEYPKRGSGTNFKIPAATFTQDLDTGIVTRVPGTGRIVITGTI